MRSPSSEMKSGLKKGSWSQEEDEMLISYINKYGIWNWSHMPKFAGLMRSGKSCRLRWMNYLKPNIKRGNFSKDEEEIILHYHSLLGNRWSAIASKLQGRSDNEIKNYWHTHLKKRVNHNYVCETTEQHDMNLSSVCEDSVAEKKQDDDKAYNHCGSLFLQTSEDDSSSSDEWKHDYYDLRSPGTIKDLQGFWKQLCPLETLDLGAEDISFGDVFPYSYDNDYNTI